MTREEMLEMCEMAASIALERIAGDKKETKLTREEVAKRLNVDKSTLWRWHKTGYLRGTKVGGKVFYSLDAVEKIEKGEVMA